MKVYEKEYEKNENERIQDDEIENHKYHVTKRELNTMHF